MEKILIAQWCIARTCRSLGKIDEAIQLQLSILEQNEQNGLSPNGYVFEGLGECYYELGELEKSKVHFQKVYKLLSLDTFLQNAEPERLQRLLKLSS